MKDKDSTIARSRIAEPVRERLWGKSAGRCVLCARSVIDDKTFWHDINVGELAHNVGASDGANSPRGNSALTAQQRSDEENLLLLCHDCHRRIDSEAHRGDYSVEFLREKKAEHERRVREVTDFPTLRSAIVLRVTATIRGTHSPASPRQISESLRSEGLTGLGASTRNGIFAVDLPDAETNEWSWAKAVGDLDRAVERVAEAVAAGDCETVAVMALAPIPILTYLGSRLDDKTEMILFPRRRTDDVAAWSWPADITREPVQFLVSAGEPNPATADVCVLVNVSGTISSEFLPTPLREAPQLIIEPNGATPSPDLIASKADLESFAGAWRNALASIEASWPNAVRVHVLAAVPTTVAIAMGRHHMRDAHPDLHLYQRRSDGTYDAVLEVQS